MYVNQFMDVIAMQMDENVGTQYVYQYNWTTAGVCKYYVWVLYIAADQTIHQFAVNTRHHYNLTSWNKQTPQTHKTPHNTLNNVQGSHIMWPAGRCFVMVAACVCVWEWMKSPSLTPAFRGKVHKQSGMFVTVRRNVQLLTVLLLGYTPSGSLSNTA